MKSFLLFFTLILSVSWAQAETGKACYQNEVNPRTKKIYTSEEEWSLDITEWGEKEPPRPGFFMLAKAYSAYKSASATANGLKNDKRAHCFMGCVIRGSTDLQTVTYVAWLKESRDLQDCSKSTHFEVADMSATILGGELGESATTPDECLILCQQQF